MEIILNNMNTFNLSVCFNDDVPMDFEYTSFEKQQEVKENNEVSKRLESVFDIDPSLINWDEVSSNVDLPVELYKKFKKHLRWNKVSENIVIHKAILLRKYVDWKIFQLTHNVKITSETRITFELTPIDPENVMDESVPATDSEKMFYYVMRNNIGKTNLH